MKQGHQVLSPGQQDSINNITPQLFEYGLAYWPPFFSAMGLSFGDQYQPEVIDIVSVNRAGYWVRTFYPDWYENLHIIPQRIVLGNVLTVQVRDLEVWNGYYGPMTLQQIQEEGTEGLELDADEPPREFAPLESRMWEVSIGLDGPPAILAFYHLLWEGDRQITLRIEGSRVVTWPHRHNWRVPILDRYEWLTDIMTAWDGTEERRALRNLPRRVMEHLCTLQGREAAAADAKLWGWAGRVFAVPVWSDRSRLAAEVSPGMQTIPLDVTDLREYEPGSLVLIRRAWDDFEIAEVAAVGSDFLELDQPIENPWPAGTEVYPARLARLPLENTVQRITPNLGEMQLRWEADDRRTVDPGEAVTTYRGHEVLTMRPNRNQAVPLTYQRTMDRHDNQTGVVVLDDRPGRPRVGQQLSFVIKTRADLFDFLAFLYRRQGRRHPFWMSTWQTDMEVAAVISAAATSFDIRAVGFSRFYGVTTGRRDVEFLLESGQVLRRRVVAVEDLGDGTERLSIDTALGQTVQPGDVRRLSFLTLQRMASDAVEISRETAGVARVTFNTRSLDHDE
mgnify:CR=1 FL=1